MTEDSRALEILVAKIQQQLAPGAEVLHDVRLPGKESKRDRQIDVLVRQKIGQYEMLIVLDCKDYARPVDVKGVEEFYGLLTDVGAHKGALVCPKGFSQAAKERATGFGVDLYSPVDTDPHKWQVRLTVPMLCDFRSAGISFKIQTSAPMPFRMPYHFYDALVARDPDTKRELGLPREIAFDRWNNGDFPTDPGEHEDLSLYGHDTVLVDNGYDNLIPVAITVSLFVQQRLFYGTLPIKRISGFKDELLGAVITNAFTTGIIDPNEVERPWTQLASESDAPQRPVLKMIGLVGYEA
jgi:hypothetical protein